MAKKPIEIIQAAGDRLHDAAGFTMYCVDATLEYLDRENGPFDKIYTQTLKLQSWILDHTVSMSREE